uniref:Uncharacterized protein n=1 Tax=Romanomermis culicivorax TaxID=13658 RepID=A0A915K0P7_ROMCU
MNRTTGATPRRAVPRSTSRRNDFSFLNLLGTLLLASCNGKSTSKSKNWTTSGTDICIEVEHHKEGGNSILIIWSEGPKAQAPHLLTQSTGRP